MPSAGWKRAPVATAFWLLLAACVVAGVAWYTALHAELLAASSGFSPVSLLHPVAKLPNFANDFPSGEAGLLLSLIGQIYYLVGQLSDAHDQILIGLLVAVEAAALIAGAAMLSRQLNPKLPLWAAIGGGIFLASGALVSADWARWFHPTFGNAYNFAYAAGFVAVAATLGGRMVVAGLAIGLAAAFHPIIALFFGCAAAVAVLVRLRDYAFVSLLGGAAAAIAVFGLWYAFAFDGAGFSGEVDGTLFTDLTRLMSSHWFPANLGVFGERSWEALLPFTALLVVFAAVLRLRDPDAGRSDVQMLAAVIALVLIALLGVWFSLHSNSPALITLALHRASLVALLLAAALLTPRLLVLAVNGPMLLAWMAGGLLILSYWRAHGLPIAGAAVFAATALIMRRQEQSGADRIVTVAALAMAAVVAASLAWNGHAAALWNDTLWTLEVLRSKPFIAAVALVIAARFLASPVLLAMAVGIGAYIWMPSVDTMRSEDQRQEAGRMLETQLWARANTPPDSVFMVDPTISYGWRQYSQRPSFGTVREWLYSGWLYNTDPKVMAEGLRRAALLGLDVPTYTEIAKTDFTRAYTLLVTDATRLFGEKDAATLTSLARENGIAFFVYDRRKVERLPALPVVFENDQYVILQPPG